MHLIYQCQSVWITHVPSIASNVIITSLKKTININEEGRLKPFGAEENGDSIAKTIANVLQRDAHIIRIRYYSFFFLFCSVFLLWSWKSFAIVWAFLFMKKMLYFLPVDLHTFVLCLKNWLAHNTWRVCRRSTFFPASPRFLPFCKTCVGCVNGCCCWLNCAFITFSFSFSMASFALQHTHNMPSVYTNLILSIFFLCFRNAGKKWVKKKLTMHKQCKQGDAIWTKESR